MRPQPGTPACAPTKPSSEHFRPHFRTLPAPRSPLLGSEDPETRAEPAKLPEVRGNRRSEHVRGDRDPGQCRECARPRVKEQQL